MKKYIIILITAIVIIIGYINIRNYFLLKDIFIFNKENLVLATVLNENGADTHGYEVSDDLVENISKELNKSKLKRIQEDTFWNYFKSKGIELFFNGEKIDNDTVSYKEKIVISKQEDDTIYIWVEKNKKDNVEPNTWNSKDVINRYYRLESKNMAKYIDELYESNES